MVGDKAVLTYRGPILALVHLLYTNTEQNGRKDICDRHAICSKRKTTQSCLN